MRGGDFARLADSVVGGLNFTDPFSLWWLLGSRITAAVTAHRLPLGLTRSVASALACMAGLGVLAAYAAKRRSQRRAYDALALLALMGLLRCIADPDPLEYNFVALLIPLAAWEAVTLERLPIMSALATAAVAVLGTGSVAMMAGTAWSLGPAAVSALSLGWTLALASYLGYRAVSTRSSGVRRPKLPLVIRTASARGGS